MAELLADDPPKGPRRRQGAPAAGPPVLVSALAFRTPACCRCPTPRDFVPWCTVRAARFVIAGIRNASHNRTFALHQKSRYSINSSAVTGSLSGTVESELLRRLEVDR